MVTQQIRRREAMERTHHPIAMHPPCLEHDHFGYPKVTANHESDAEHDRRPEVASRETYLDDIAPWNADGRYSEQPTGPVCRSDFQAIRRNRRADEFPAIGIGVDPSARLKDFAARIIAVRTL